MPLTAAPVRRNRSGSAPSPREETPDNGRFSNVETYFNRLGGMVDAYWRDAQRDTERLPEAAARAFRELPPNEYVKPIDIAGWGLLSAQLPPQNIFPFGQPPLEVFRGERFFIQVLHWLDGTTNIHQHGFSGAFVVLAGSSIHAEYKFSVDERVNHRLMFGKTRLKSMELLQTGDIRPIPLGGAFIHALFHLDHPSITVVIRTDGERSGEPQYSYLKPHVALDPTDKNDRTERRVGLAHMLSRLDDKDGHKAILDFTRQTDLHTIVRVLHAIYHDPTAKGGAAALGGELFFRILSVARKRHGGIVDLLVPVFDEERRQNGVRAMRSLVRNPAHRFLLAALLNASEKKAVYELLRQYRKETAPADLIVQWVKEMGPAASGVNLEAAQLDVLQLMLDGKEPHQIVKALRLKKPAIQTEEVRRLRDSLRDSDLFRPLFNDQA